MDAIEAILSRRTHKHLTGEAVPRETLERLLGLAIWAPNHKMTEPWRFFVVTHNRIERLVDAVDRSVGGSDPPKLHRKRDKLLRRLPHLGAFINVARKPVPDDPVLDREDYAACCCAVHNMMLGATALGLGSFWSTGVLFERPPVRDFLGMPPGLERVASLWLGVPRGPASSKRSGWAERTVWV